MQAIVTKYLGPTNSRPARISATADAGRVVVSWDHALDIDGNHEAAARMLAEHLGWLDGYTMVGGSLPRIMGGNAYVLIPKSEK